MMFRKSYVGTPPDGEQWMHYNTIDPNALPDISEVAQEDLHVEWRVYVEIIEGKEWVAVKLCANGTAKHKANYSLAWSAQQQRLAGTPGGETTLEEFTQQCVDEGRHTTLNKDPVLLWKGRPWLYKVLMGVLQGMGAEGDLEAPPTMRLTVTNHAKWAYHTNGVSKKGAGAFLPDICVHLQTPINWGVLFDKLSSTTRKVFSEVVPGMSMFEVVNLLYGRDDATDSALRTLAGVFMDALTSSKEGLPVFEGESERRSASMKTAESGPKSDLDEYFN